MERRCLSRPLVFAVALTLGVWIGAQNHALAFASPWNDEGCCGRSGCRRDLDAPACDSASDASTPCAACTLGGTLPELPGALYCAAAVPIVVTDTFTFTSAPTPLLRPAMPHARGPPLA